MRAWTAVRHLLGDATDLPGFLERACASDPDVRRHARFGLRERLVSTGVYTTAAPRLVQELLSEVLDPETPDLAGLLDLLAEIAAADTSRLAFHPHDAAPEDPQGAEVWSVLDLRSIELSWLTQHDDPAVRAHAMRLISLAVPDAPLPDQEPDPAVEATLALAHARRGTPFTPVGALAALILDFWHSDPTPERATEAAAVLVPAPDPSRFVWADGDLDAALIALLARHAARDAIATVFAHALTVHPDDPRHPAWTRAVAEYGFPDPLDPDALTAAQRLWAEAVLHPDRPTPLPGLPSRSIDARRLLGLAPPGPLEAETPEGPVWTVLSGVPAAELAHRLTPLPRPLQVAALVETLFGGHDLEVVPADALEDFLLDPDWAADLLTRIRTCPVALRPWGRGTPAHANVARLALAAQNLPAPEHPRVSFTDRPARVDRTLQTLDPAEREATLLAFLTDPDRADFQEAAVLDALLPHLENHAVLVPDVLNAIAALLDRVHRAPDVERVLVAAWVWCAKHDVPTTNEWRARLSVEEQAQLATAVEQVSPGATS